MKVLFILSSLEPAGSETYCVALEKIWKGRHQVHWISDRLHFGQSYTSLPIHQKSILGGILNTLRVARYVRENGIELIHSHSRRAHWVAAQAAALAHIPHVTTIHQPPPVHLFSRLFPCLGDHTIAIDEAVQDHLQKYFRRGIKKLSLIRNGIEIQPSPPAPLPNQGEGGRRPGEGEVDNRVLYLGRLTGGRWRALKFFFEVLKRSGASLPKTCYQIVGRIPEERAGELQEELKQVNRAIHPSLIETHDFVTNLAPFVAGCRGVIGGGRSALESMAAERPVIALGEKGIVGLCTEETWAEAMRTNFGDHYDTPTDQFYPPKLELGLRELLGNDASVAGLGRWGRAQVERNYNIRTIAGHIDQIYQDLCTSPS